MPNPRFPIYMPSKSRFDYALTARYLTRINVPFRMVVEEQQYDDYARHFPPEKLIVLDPAYQRDYQLHMELPENKSRGSGPARNFIWDLSIAEGHTWHWIMDDNIRKFARLHQNEKHPVADGTIFYAMEDFVLRYTNIGMAGPNYWSFALARDRLPPFYLNTRIYSCNLIRNDLPFRWRGRYNEDTILSLDMLKAKWCTVLFNAFLQEKLVTQHVKGGNTEAFYAEEGTLPKSRMLVEQQPDMARLTWRFGRWHHYIDYRPFQSFGLVRRPDYQPPPVNPYRLTKVSGQLHAPGAVADGNV